MVRHIKTELLKIFSLLKRNLKINTNFYHTLNCYRTTHEPSKLEILGQLYRAELKTVSVTKL